MGSVAVALKMEALAHCERLMQAFELVINKCPTETVVEGGILHPLQI